MISVAAELLQDARADLAEGPHWDPARRRLLWVDIPRGAVHLLDPDTGTDDVTLHGNTVGAAVPRLAGGLALAHGTGFLLVGHDGTRQAAVAADSTPDVRMNDGACDPSGRFWAGTMDLHEADPTGSLYRLDPDLTVTRVLAGVTVSNGLAWSPQGDRLYYVDSPTGGIDEFSFDADAGDLGPRRRLVDVPVDEGFPDGITVDGDGGIWVALWQGGQVRRYTPDGVLDRVVTVPATLTTSCAFGGPRLDQLFITTARVALSDAERHAQPHAGGIFVCEPGVTGLPANAFAG